MSVLDKIQGSIKNGKLELKDKKKDRMLKALGRMDKGYFEEFISRSGELKKNITSLREELDKITEVTEIETLKGKLEEEEAMAEENKKAMEDLQNKLNNIDIEELRKKLLNSHDIFK